ncbi:hypothetical protein BGZ79_007005 [Entomortierella chlamydospora]|nr:hypothetical protein BGZ79_007005 [Entomortierella chlamydospora]
MPAPEAVSPTHNLNVGTIVIQPANNINASKNDNANEGDISAAAVDKGYAQGEAQEVAVLDEELAKLEAAANETQSVCGGYQSRQEVCGPELTTAQKWRHLIDFCRSEQIYKFHAEGTCTQNNSGQAVALAPSDGQSNGSRARRAWRRAEFLGSRLGKGSNGVSSEEALVLLTEHWLEMSDQKHRYGSNLKPYHEYWLGQETSQNFFYWLDKGDGKDVDLEERPRARLEEQKVRYLQDHERAQYVVHAVNGLLYYKASGKPVHTLPDDVQAGDDVDVSQVMPEANENDDEATMLEKKRIRNKSKFIYVTDPKGTLYVAQKIRGQFHHSSFFGGGTVCSAGGIIINHGKLIKITPKSGHYRPRQQHFDRLLENLKEMGVSLADVKISYGVLGIHDLGTTGVEELTTNELSPPAPSGNKDVDQVEN